MIEPPKLFTHERLIFDIREIELLATFIIDLCIPIDRVLCESFEKLVELAGTREFLTSFSKLQQVTLQYKRKKLDALKYGWIVPVSSFYELNNWNHSIQKDLDTNPCTTNALDEIINHKESHGSPISIDSLDFERFGLRKLKIESRASPLPLYPSDPLIFDFEFNNINKLPDFKESSFDTQKYPPFKKGKFSCNLIPDYHCITTTPQNACKSPTMKRSKNRNRIKK